MIWFVASLIPLTAFLMGAVHPWAFKAMEEIVLALVVVWITRIALGRCGWPTVDRKFRLPLIGLLLLLSTVAFQLVPLPVQVEKVISPSTYRLYQLSLPGWPERRPYSWLFESTIPPVAISNVRQDKLTSQGGAQHSTRPLTEKSTEGASERQHRFWFPISVAPSLTKVALLKFLSYFLLGLLTVYYPFQSRDSRLSGSYQALMRMLLVTGLLLGLVGLLQEFISNGKPLWIFTPYTFKSPDMWQGRAFGPFADPDHYACFLAMLLPPALVGIIFPEVLGKVRERAAVPLLSGAVAVIIIAALLATASRGGMLNAAVGVVVLGWLSSRLPAERLPKLFQLKRKRHLILAASMAALLSLAVYLAGNANQTLTDARLKESFSSESIGGRLIPAEDSMHMIADFPVFGIGMGAWPDLYRKYTRPPWSPVFMNATHDEYVQFLAETGAIGFLLLATFIFIIGRQTSHAILDLPTDQFAVVASFVASLVGLATHAVLDFPLRVPAIAVLATILCGFVIRATFQERTTDKSAVKMSAGKSMLGAAGIAIGLLGLMWVVTLQPQAPYPYDLKTPQNSEQMEQLLLAHPANSRVHIMLIALMDTKLPEDKALEELKTTVALEPNNPVAHDMYVRSLARHGQNEAALDQITESVFRAPDYTDHFYLNASWVPKLTTIERDAIEKGLQAAVRNGFANAITTLGDYYGNLREFHKEAALFRDSARTTRDPEQQAQLLSRAGSASAKAGNYQQAVNILQEAIRLRPEDTTAYEVLSMDVDAQKQQFDSARAVLNQGIQAGADAVTLYLKLAEVNRVAKDKNGEEEALKQVADLQPYNSEASHALGDVYLSDGRADQAILWLRKSTEANPSSAMAFFELAEAEELDYQFAAAQNDYTKALALEPDNLGMQAQFQQFKDRVAANSKPN
jgi:tetratricopeptide (TPR) repeat protein